MDSGQRPPDTRTSRPKAEQGVRQMMPMDEQPLFRPPMERMNPYEPYQQRPVRVEIPRNVQEEYAPGGGNGRRRPPRDRKNPVWVWPVILVCLGALALAGWFVQGELARYAQHLAIREKVHRSTFYPNTHIDGIDVSGKTREEAMALLAAQSQQRSAEFALSIAYGETRWRIDSSQVPVGAKYESAVRVAYAPGRSGSLSKRYGEVRSIETYGINLTSEWGYDREKVRELTDLVVGRINVPATDARLTAFDPNARSFVFEPEQVGYQANAEKLFNDVTATLDAKQYNAEVQVQVETVQPRLRQADIANSFGRIASYSTKTTTDNNRNTNIALSAQAINGKVLLPGETMSFNECTGQRTAQKGYREAGAIQQGQLVDETGGGVCQTSSTLFNAVVRADLEIVARSRHSWPSTYVPKGEDAAVDWPRLDFKFRNNQDMPVFIVAWYADQVVTVEVYGRMPEGGRTIDLRSTTVQEREPSSEVIYTRSLDLAPGTQKVAKQKRTGYVVDTFKVYFVNGAEVERTKLWRTEYPPVQKEIYFN